jgi:hypothetical protein
MFTGMNSTHRVPLADPEALYDVIILIPRYRYEYHYCVELLYFVLGRDVKLHFRSHR